MAWADDLPRIKAENQAWRDEYLPRVRALQAERNRERDEARALFRAALETLTEDERALVLRVRDRGSL